MAASCRPWLVYTLNKCLVLTFAAKVLCGAGTRPGAVVAPSYLTCMGLTSEIGGAGRVVARSSSIATTTADTVRVRRVLRHTLRARPFKKFAVLMRYQLGTFSGLSRCIPFLVVGCVHYCQGLFQVPHSPRPHVLPAGLTHEFVVVATHGY